MLETANDHVIIAFQALLATVGWTGIAFIYATCGIAVALVRVDVMRKAFEWPHFREWIRLIPREGASLSDRIEGWVMFPRYSRVIQREGQFSCDVGEFHLQSTLLLADYCGAKGQLVGYVLGMAILWPLAVFRMVIEWYAAAIGAIYRLVTWPLRTWHAVRNAKLT